MISLKMNTAGVTTPLSHLLKSQTAPPAACCLPLVHPSATAPFHILLFFSSSVSAMLTASLPAGSDGHLTRLRFRAESNLNLPFCTNLPLTLTATHLLYLWIQCIHTNTSVSIALFQILIIFINYPYSIIHTHTHTDYKSFILNLSILSIALLKPLHHSILSCPPL